MPALAIGDEVMSLPDMQEVYVIGITPEAVTVSDGVANEWSYPPSAFVTLDADIDPEGFMWTFRIVGYTQRDDIGILEITCPECTTSRLNDGATMDEPCYRNQIAPEGEMCLLCLRNFDNITTTETEIHS
jgi:hypothetical protein